MADRVGVRMWKLSGRPTPFTWALLIGIAAILLLAFLPEILLRLVGQPNWLRYMATVAQRLHHAAESDSWGPIAAALDHLHSQGAAGLYEATFHHAEEQFQYPPTSLIFAELMEWAGIVQWNNFGATNDLFWWTLPASALALALTTIAATPNDARRAELGMRDLLLAGFFAAILTLGYYPIVFALYLGQIQSWLNFLMIGAILLWLMDRRLAAGIALGLVCIIKPLVAPVLLWGILRREWNFVGGIVATVGAFGLASLARYGWPLHAEYLGLMQFLSRRGESYADNQSVNGLMNRMLNIGNNLEWDGAHRQIVFDMRVYLATLTSAVLFTGMGLLYRLRQPATALDLGLILVLFTLASPQAFPDHFGASATVFVLLYLRRLQRRTSAVDWVIIGVAFTLMANKFDFVNRFAGTSLTYLQSSFMIGVLLLIVAVVRVNRPMANTVQA